MIKKHLLVLIVFLSTTNYSNASFYKWHVQMQQFLQDEIDSVEEGIFEVKKFMFPSKKHKNITLNVYKNNKTNKVGIEINVPGKFNKEEINIKITDQGILKIIAEKADSYKTAEKTYIYQEKKHKKKKCYIRMVNLKNFEQLKDLTFDVLNSNLIQDHKTIKDKYSKKQTQITLEFDNISQVKNNNFVKNETKNTKQNIIDKDKPELINKKIEQSELETELEIKLK